MVSKPLGLQAAALMKNDLVNQPYDVVVIGAGLGGLLSAAHCLQRGMRVAVLERLAHCGGRFTAKTFQGAQVSTGAVHMLPFGSNGVLAGMLRRLAVPHYVHDAEVFASFFVHGRQYVCRSLLGVAAFLGARQFTRFLMLGPALLARRLPASERDLPFPAWLEKHHVTPDRSPELYAFFERISHFALSVPLEQMSAREVAETTKNMFRYGPPGVVEGGCAAVTGELERRLREQGVDLRLRHDVLRILTSDGEVTGIRVRDKATGVECVLQTPLVISNIGPNATMRLIAGAAGDQSTDVSSTFATFSDSGASRSPLREAVGLKTHVLSERSLIPHKGIMYCLDTERIAGIVQPSNCDARLAPPGKHLLITHQVMRSDDVEQERALAVADLRRIIGPAFERDCRILTMSQYRGEWPVNRAQQGGDFAPEIGVRGLYLVGDAIKPSGYLMVEGVAQSVNQMLDLLDQFDQRTAPQKVGQGQTVPVGNGKPMCVSHVPPKPRAARALYWLFAPPPPAKQERLQTPGKMP